MSDWISERLIALFWSRVRKGEGPNDCWEWTAGKSTTMRYGAMSLGKLGTEYAHRIGYRLANGAIPKGMCVCHICDNPPCVRADHLFLGSLQDNIADKVAKNRQHRGERTGGVALTDNDVAAILTAYATGEFSVWALGLEYHVSEATMRSVVNGETWAHVPGPRLSRSEIVAIGKKHRANGLIAAKRAAGWPAGACSVCGVRGHYKTTCPQNIAA